MSDIVEELGGYLGDGSEFLDSEDKNEENE